MTTQELKELIAAEEAGEVIECTCPGTGEWVQRPEQEKGEWLFDLSNYRVKREPKVVWLNEYPCGVSVAYDSREAADIVAGPSRIACRKFVEVIEEGK